MYLLTRSSLVNKLRLFNEIKPMHGSNSFHEMFVTKYSHAV